MVVDYEKLREGLNKLSGLDIEQAEMQERKAGASYPDITFTLGFRARLAAKALGVQVQDIKELNARDYQKVAQSVMSFLFNSEEEEEASAEK